MMRQSPLVSAAKTTSSSKVISSFLAGVSLELRCTALRAVVLVAAGRAEGSSSMRELCSVYIDKSRALFAGLLDVKTWDMHITQRDYLRRLLDGDTKATPTAPTDDVAVEPSLDFQLDDFTIDDHKPMKIIAIGAGMSGILASISFRQYIHNLKLMIYEKEDRIGGTWHVNRYSGVACDYRYSFENKSNLTAVYSPGSEILEHMEQIVAKYKLEAYIKLCHELTHARYDEAAAKWHDHVKRPSSTAEGQYEGFEDKADFLSMGVGVLSRWNWPRIGGFYGFKRTLVHSADWNLGGAMWKDDVKDRGEKSVAVIGLFGGLGAIGPVCRRVDLTWVVPPFLRDKASAVIANKAAEGDENYKSTDEGITILEDPAKLADLRRVIDRGLYVPSTYLPDSEAPVRAQKRSRKHGAAALASAPEIALEEKCTLLSLHASEVATTYSLLTPTIWDFSTSCRQLTPAPGYLKGLTDGKDAVDTTDAVVTKHDDLKLEVPKTVKGPLSRCGEPVSYRKSSPASPPLLSS
ncbi:hypothetical protein NM688_g5222 [Phlebia brevispora]|uniref:Uncharacterized protein n=1 Tax=Phlebia brevispora TaxID=194682 RepID=A0ACC1SYX2_9APHY|nr:hypothetical protein NM688_g5222 [Phlebia brevispora]